MKLKSSYAIYFADVYFKNDVYVFGSGRGLARKICAYTVGQNEEDARSQAFDKYNHDGTEVSSVVVSLAHKQDLSRYPVPKLIIGIDKALQLQ